jgi:hypothetical protein
MRFTIRDLLWLTVVVAVAFAGIANYRQLTTVVERWSASVWNDVSQMEPPLMGRKSVSEWDPDPGTK